MKTVLYSGWLTKSPPEHKAHGPLKIFKSKWRKRFFVLSKIHDANVLPGTCPAQLEYFDNEKQANRKGSINLNNCEQIFVHFESKRYNHIFVVKTTDRGQQRSYYLAADSVEVMDRWVEKLSSLLLLQDQGPLPPIDTRFTPSPTKNIPPFSRHHQASTPVSSGDSSGLLSPASEMHDPFDSPPRSGNQRSPEDYFPLDQCSSGGTPILAPRVVTENSVKVVTVSVRNQPRNTSCSSQQSDRDSEVYKVPPPLLCQGAYQEPSSDTTYDYPVSSDREWRRDSNYDYPPPLNSLPDEGGRDATYDYPPSVPRRSCGSDSERPLWECESSKPAPEVVGDTYDLLPRRSLVLPPRHSNVDAHSVGDVYDIPASCRTSNLPPPPPKGHPPAPKVHRYINAAPAAVLSVATQDAASNDDDGVYLAMSNVESGDNVYMPMTEVGDFDRQVRRMKSNAQSSANRAGEKPPKAPVTLPRSFAKEGFTVVNHADVFIDSCHATQRTRSFIRHIPSPSSDNVILPQKVRMSPSSSSSEDEDETSSEASSVQEYLNLQISVGPGNESQLEQGKPVVQYLDLDLDPSAARSSVGPGSSDPQNKIEYNEIDVERTTALFNTKLTLEKERKGSDKSEP